MELRFAAPVVERLNLELRALRIFLKAVAAFAVLCVLGAAGFYVVAHRPAIAKREGPPPKFADAEVLAGQTIAAAGNCAACHTRPNGAPYAGGLPIPTSFGTIYASNITPDPDAGIGSWTLEAFTRAMREGTARGGTQLYPAFPYDHYTKLTDPDIAALYAYVTSRTPVAEQPPRTAMPFPYGFRPLMAGWKMLYLDKRPFEPDSSKSEAWNRGAYLVAALGHCGSCHTPRNRLGAEVASQSFDGGEVGGWWAPPLNAKSPALVPWSEESLFNYLRSWDSLHGGAAGPMAEVTASMQRLPDNDVRAIATYVADLMSGAQDRSAQLKDIEQRRLDTGQDRKLQNGKAVYDGLCASCHESDGTIPFTTRSLAQHTILHGPDPRNAVNVVMKGLAPPEDSAGGIMPAFGSLLSDEQVTDLMAYLRRRYTNSEPWPDIGPALRDARRQSEVRSATTR